MFVHRLNGWNGSLTVDGTEVQGVRWVSMDEFRRQMALKPEQFTQWCLEEVQHLGWS